MPLSGVVTDFTIAFHLNLLRNGVVLFLFLGQKSFDPESLLRRHGKEQSISHTMLAEKRFNAFLYQIRFSYTGLHIIVHQLKGS